MNVPSKTPLLDRVRHPADLRNLSTEQLKQLAGELRAETIDAVSVTGGHLGASLGVVELTVALHAVFDTPSEAPRWPPVTETASIVSARSSPASCFSCSVDRLRKSAGCRTRSRSGVLVGTLIDDPSLHSCAWACSTRI